MNVLWASRHPPLQAELAELERAFGNVQIIWEKRHWDNAEEIVEVAKKHKCSVIVPVLPLAMLHYLCEVARREGIVVLFAEMYPLHQCRGCDDYDERTDVLLPTTGTTFRHMRFKRFRRVRRVKIEFED